MEWFAPFQIFLREVRCSNPISRGACCILLTMPVGLVFASTEFHTYFYLLQALTVTVEGFFNVTLGLIISSPFLECLKVGLTLILYSGKVNPIRSCINLGSQWVVCCESSRMIWNYAHYIQLLRCKLLPPYKQLFVKMTYCSTWHSSR